MLGTALMTSSALAADLTFIEPAEPNYSTSAFDWSGFYLGVNGGYAGGTFQHPLTSVWAVQSRLRPQVPTGGVPQTSERSTR